MRILPGRSRRPTKKPWLRSCSNGRKTCLTAQKNQQDPSAEFIAAATAIIVSFVGNGMEGFEDDKIRGQIGRAHV